MVSYGYMVILIWIATIVDGVYSESENKVFGTEGNWMYLNFTRPVPFVGTVSVYRNGKPLVYAPSITSRVMFQNKNEVADVSFDRKTGLRVLLKKIDSSDAGDYILKLSDKEAYSLQLVVLSRDQAAKALSSTVPTKGPPETSSRDQATKALSSTVPTKAPPETSTVKKSTTKSQELPARISSFATSTSENRVATKVGENATLNFTSPSPFSKSGTIYVARNVSDREKDYLVYYSLALQRPLFIKKSKVRDFVKVNNTYVSVLMKNLTSSDAGRYQLYMNAKQTTAIMDLVVTASSSTTLKTTTVLPTKASMEDESMKQLPETADPPNTVSEDNEEIRCPQGASPPPPTKLSTPESSKEIITCEKSERTVYAMDGEDAILELSSSSPFPKYGSLSVKNPSDKYLVYYSLRVARVQFQSMKDVRDVRFTGKGFRLVMKEVDVSDAGEYKMWVSGRDIRTTSKLIVLSTPKIVVTQPLSENRPVEKRPYRMECQASSAGKRSTCKFPLSYRWTANETVITSQSERYKIVNSWLEIKSVEKNDHQLKFTCQASHDAGTSNLWSDMSEVFSIQQPHYGPRFKGQFPSSLSVFKSGALTVDCSEFTDANPEATYLWKYPNGTVIRNTPVLSIASASREDSGTYTCVATNTVERVGECNRTRSLSASINVTVSGNVKRGPLRKVILENKSLTVNCRDLVERVNENSVWRKVGGNVVSNTPVLSFSRTSRNDSGSYVCTDSRSNVVNGHLLDNSKVLNLSVLYGPEFKEDFPSKKNLREGEQLLVDCDEFVDADPSPTKYEWRSINGSLVSEHSVLSFQEASSEDGGEYTCTVTNVLKLADRTIRGQNSAKLVLTVSDYCLPGSYSETGVPPCNLCKKGSYNQNYNSSTCYPCVGGYSTANEGSTSPTDCVAYDLRIEQESNVTSELTESTLTDFSLVVWVYVNTESVSRLTMHSKGHSEVTLVISTEVILKVRENENILVQSVQNQAWNHFAVVHNSSNGKIHLYANGVSDGGSINKKLELTGGVVLGIQTENSDISVNGLILLQNVLSEADVSRLSKMCSPFILKSYLSGHNFLKRGDKGISIVIPSRCNATQSPALKTTMESSMENDLVIKGGDVNVNSPKTFFDFTLVFWVYINSSSTCNITITCGENNQVILLVLPDLQLNLARNGAVHSSLSADLGWNHLVITHTTFRKTSLYVNGKYRAHLENPPRSPQPCQSVKIQTGSAGIRLNGLFLLDTPLSAAEILALSTRCSPFILHYALSAADISPARNVELSPSRCQAKPQVMEEERFQKQQPTYVPLNRYIVGNQEVVNAEINGTIDIELVLTTDENKKNGLMVFNEKELFNIQGGSKPIIRNNKLITNVQLTPKKHVLFTLRNISLKDAGKYYVGTLGSDETQRHFMTLVVSAESPSLKSTTVLHSTTTRTTGSFSTDSTTELHPTTSRTTVSLSTDSTTTLPSTTSGTTGSSSTDSTTTLPSTTSGTTGSLSTDSTTKLHSTTSGTSGK